MFCDVCGTQVESGRFCPKCGNPMKAAQPAAPAAPQQPYGASSAPQQPYGASTAQQSAYWNAGSYQAPAGALRGGPGGGFGSYAMDAVRKIAGSNLFLAGTILFCAATLISLISGIVTAGEINRVTQYYSYTYGLDGELQGVTNSIRYQVPSMFIGLIPYGLIILGLWLTYASAKDRSKPMQPSGLSIIKVLLIIGMVLMIICAALLAIGGIALIVLSSQAPGESIGSAIGGSAEFSAVMQELMHNETFRSVLRDLLPQLTYISIREVVVVLSVFILVAAAVVAFIAVVLGRLVHTVNVVKNTILTNRASSKISAFAAVCCFIFGGLGIFAGASLIGNGAILSGISTLLSAASEICFGMLQFQYRTEMRQIGG